MKNILLGLLLLNILNLKAQAVYNPSSSFVMLDSNHYFEFQHKLDISTYRPSAQILKASREYLAVGITTSLLGSILYYNGMIMKYDQTPGYKGRGIREDGKGMVDIGTWLLVIGGSFNIAAIVEGFNFQDQIARESLKAKLHRENIEMKIQEIEKQLGNLEK